MAPGSLHGLHVPVVVVGASVAGAATALHLARRGHDVLVVDRAAFPREKVCGEGLMPHGVAELHALGLLDAVRATGAVPFRGIAYHVDGAAAVGRFPPREPVRDGLGLRRLHLDAVLVEALAAEPRVRLVTGVRVRDLLFGPDAVSVETDEGTVTTRLVIGADGLHSAVRKRLGLDEKDRRAPRYGVRAHFRVRTVPQEVHVWVADTVEFYVTPTAKDELNVAILCGRDTTRALGGDLSDGFRRLVLAFPPVAAVVDGADLLSEPAVTGPLRQRVRGLVADRALLVGDAGGFVDAITGEGMSLALVSARLAAEVASEALPTGRLDADSLRPYEHAQRAFARDSTRLTETVLWGLRNRFLARRVVGQLGRHPDLFGQVLSVATGQSRLASLGLRGALRLLVG